MQWCSWQEIVRPDVFWYDAALKSPMPFGNSPAAILGLVRDGSSALTRLLAPSLV